MCSSSSSQQKFENDMLLLRKKIKHHEENIKILKTHMNTLDDEITNKQVTLRKHHSSSAPMIEEADLSQLQSEEATIGNIMKHEKSAAAVFCHLKRHGNQAAHIKDVLGVVATLGKVHDANLSWLLSEYLGLDNMMSLVCITYDGIKALVTYDKGGAINKSSGLYGLGTAIGQPLEGRFNVICLEQLRPYVGEFMPNDPQKRLDLFKPRLPNGEAPAGFIGFAVNMIHIDDTNLFYLTNDGNGLRETLFYTFFLRLQVYKTSAEMVQALPCIYDGAISLDGGMIKSNGVYSLGTREEIDVKFPITSGISYLPEACIEVEKELKELKWRRKRMMEDIQREEALLSNVKYSFEVKKQEFHGFMAQTSPYTMPVRWSMSGSQEEPEHVPETQPERPPESSQPKKRLHKIMGDAARAPTRKSYQQWTKDEEYALARAWLDISEDPKVANYQGSPLSWTRIRETFFRAMGRREYREPDSISGKWTDINKKCHGFQEVYQRMKDNCGSDCGDKDILKKVLEEYNAERGTFAYMRCWELLKGSSKWANVQGMMSTRRIAKRSKTSSSIDPEVPTSDTRNVDLNEEVKVEEEELPQPPVRRSARKGRRAEPSSMAGELKDDFEEMNRCLQDIRDLKARRLETKQKMAAEKKRFAEIQKARQMEKDIEFLSRSPEGLTGDALILFNMHTQQIRAKYNL